jgi:hypothetical protein
VAGPAVEPIGFAHNGFHVDDEERFRPVSPRAAPSAGPSADRSGHFADGYDRLAHSIDSLSHSFTDLFERQNISHSFGRPERYEPTSTANRPPDHPDPHHRTAEQRSRHQLPDDPAGGNASGPRHFRADADDLTNYGRHSLPGRDQFS